MLLKTIIVVPTFEHTQVRVKKSSKKKKRNSHAHFVNATLVASQRTACCVLENYYDGGVGVRVPDVLVSYMDGEKVMR